MNDIPIRFEYKGKVYDGIFSSVSGAGMSTGMFSLNINGFFKGRLWYSEYPGRFWVFKSQTGQFEELSEFFGNYIVAWTDSLGVD